MSRTNPGLGSLSKLPVELRHQIYSYLIVFREYNFHISWPRSLYLPPSLSNSLVQTFSSVFTLSKAICTDHQDLILSRDARVLKLLICNHGFSSSVHPSIYWHHDRNGNGSTSDFSMFKKIHVCFVPPPPDDPDQWLLLRQSTIRLVELFNSAPSLPSIQVGFYEAMPGWSLTSFATERLWLSREAGKVIYWPPFYLSYLGDLGPSHTWHEIVISEQDRDRHRSYWHGAHWSEGAIWPWDHGMRGQQFDSYTRHPILEVVIESFLLLRCVPRLELVVAVSGLSDQTRGTIDRVKRLATSPIKFGQDLEVDRQIAIDARLMDLRIDSLLNRVHDWRGDASFTRKWLRRHRAENWDTYVRWFEGKVDGLDEKYMDIYRQYLPSVERKEGKNRVRAGMRGEGEISSSQCSQRRHEEQRGKRPNINDQNRQQQVKLQQGNGGQENVFMISDATSTLMGARRIGETRNRICSYTWDRERRAEWS